MAIAGVLFLFLGLLVGTAGWPHGAPGSACGTLLPSHHGQPPSNSPSPYSIVLYQTTYTPGQPVAISLLAPEADPFRGFLLEIRLTDGLNIRGYVGKIIPVEGTQNVNGCEPSTLTHTDSNKRSFQNLTVTWIPPDQPAGSVIVRTTFVKSFSTFWVGVTSPVITQVTTNPPIADQSVHPVTPPDTTTPSVTAKTTTDTPPVENSSTMASQPIPDGFCKNLSSDIKSDVTCGRSKGCFVSCDSYSCDYVVTWAPRDDVVEFEITARTRGSGDQWVAIGFSYDIEMGNDSVVECVSEDGIVSVYQSFNYVYYNTRLSQPHVGLREAEGCLQDGILWCKFTRDKKILENKEIEMFDLNKPWIVMFANGDVLDGVKQMHVLSPKYGPWTSGVLINFEELAMAGKGAGSRLLISLHGCFMIIAWLICASGGILAARYYRHEWPNITPFGQKMWFLIHRTSLVATFTLVVTAFFIIYEEADRGFGPVKNGYLTGKLYDAVHPTLGVVTFTLTFINPIMAIFRPKPEAELRPLFNWAHRCVGIFTFVLALFTIAFGLGMEKVGAPQIGMYVMLGFAVYQFALAVSLEVASCIQKQLAHESKEVAENKLEYQSLIDKPGFTPEASEVHWLSDFGRWKVILFVGNILIVVAVATFLMYLVVADFP